MEKNQNVYMAAIGVALCLAECADRGQSAAAESKADEMLVIYCPYPLEFVNPIVSEFENRTGVRIYTQAGSTGELLQMMGEHREPACDTFWGGSLSTTNPRQELFEPHASKNEDMVQEEFENPGDSLTCFTSMPSVIMVNTNLIGDTAVEGYEDLLKPKLKGKIAMCNPFTSLSAYKYLINMLYAMGDEDPGRGWDYVEQFCRNSDGTLLGSSTQVYQGMTGGQFAVGLTFEGGGTHHTAQGEPVRLAYIEEGIISIPDVVGIVKSNRHMAGTKDFVDFATGKDAQIVIVGRLVRRSVREDAEESEYLSDKDKIYIIYDDLGLVNNRKKEWLERSAEIFWRVSDEGQAE